MYLVIHLSTIQKPKISSLINSNLMLRLLHLFIAPSCSLIDLQSQFLIQSQGFIIVKYYLFPSFSFLLREEWDIWLLYFLWLILFNIRSSICIKFVVNYKILTFLIAAWYSFVCAYICMYIWEMYIYYMCLPQLL